MKFFESSETLRITVVFRIQYKVRGRQPVLWRGGITKIKDAIGMRRPVHRVVDRIIYFHDSAAPINENNTGSLPTPNAAFYGFVRDVIRGASSGESISKQRHLRVRCIV